MKKATDIVKKMYVTEKALMLSKLHTRNSNRSVARCKSPKYVFIVDPSANKIEIKSAVEELYHDRGVVVTAVNTLRTSRKAKRRGRGRLGYTASMKKAVVTLRENDVLE